MSDEFNQHKLTAIFYADVAGYSRHTERDERGTHQRVMKLLDYASDTITSEGSMGHTLYHSIACCLSTIGRKMR